MPPPKLPAPWVPVEGVKADAAALQAMQHGEATPDQQARAMEFIIAKIGGFRHTSYRPGGHDGDRDTAFAEGRRFVGNEIMRFVNTPLSRFDEEKSK